HYSQKFRDWLSGGNFFLGLSVSVSSINPQDLFPFGSSAGDQSLNQGTDVTQEVPLDKPVMFYDGKFSKIYINTNGFVALDKPSVQLEYLGNMPASFGMIAALLGDLDTSDGVGKVYFRQDSTPALLQQAANYINTAFPKSDEVNPIHAIVVTWVDIESHEPDGPDHKRNTFQLVVASEEKISYAILLYPREGMQYQSTRGYTMHAGFNKGQEAYFLYRKRQGPYYRITDDKKTSVQKLAQQTNSGKRGVWVYEIGTSSQFSNIVPGEVALLQEAEVLSQSYQVPKYPDGQLVVLEHTPYQHSQQETLEGVYHKAEHPSPYQVHTGDLQPGNPHFVEIEEDDNIQVGVFTYSSQTCANSRQECSSFADCQDYATGFCCHCRPGFYGNGKQCIAEGKPQRMNGKVSGRVFVGSSPIPVEFANNDLHSYVVANDGRAYIAISAIPSSVGFSLLPLASVGGVIGWAFALQQPGFKNGFSIVGGEFTSQADVTFQGGGGKLTITQDFRGIDEHDHLVVNTRLEGTVPTLPPGATVQIDPYSAVYLYSNNLINSSSSRDYVVTLEDGSTVTRTYKWTERISFQSCQHDRTARPVPQTQMLSVDQVFVMYSDSDHVLRYAMSNKIGDINGVQPEENACYTGRHSCDTNAVCQPGQGNQFTCECATGFNGDGRTCYDIDECRETPHICGPNTICNNQPGTYRCECMEGFQFASDGKTCVVDLCRADLHDCDVPVRAQCSYTGGSSYICSCLPGFVGDGRTCQDIDECQPSRCHQDAVCHNTQGSFTCRCRPGFHGDGFHCSQEQKTRCQVHRERALASAELGPRGPRPVPGQYIPTCDSQGEYESMQCHSSSGYCWCVDQDGTEIYGTRTGPGSTPSCDQVTLTVGPVPLLSGSHLVFAQSGKIEYVPLEGQDIKKDKAKTVLHLPEKVIVGIAYDCVDKMVYWTDITSPAISKVHLQGGEAIPLITSDIGSPEGIAIDHLGRTMFWTDSTKDRIEVSSLDGTKRRVLIDMDLENPRPILTDPTNGYIYWSDWNRESPKIEAAHMDGTGRRILVKDNLGLPNALTYDTQNSMLCWADAGTHKVECMKPGFSDRRQVLQGVQYPFGITAYGKNLYYTDWKRDAVIVVDHHSGRETDEFLPQVRTRLYGITLAYRQCPTGRSHCAVNNGGCTHLCLATPAGRSCLCPDNAADMSCQEQRIQV
uniref:Nidogen 1a n=1 Tax=Pygocentrus nattereri TaxID=42514 RepID=A0AAR2J865_PYGNA